MACVYSKLEQLHVLHAQMSEMLATAHDEEEATVARSTIDELNVEIADTNQKIAAAEPNTATHSGKFNRSCG